MNLLILTSRFPFPIDKGDKLRIYYQIVELSKIYNIHLISISDIKIDQSAKDEMEKYCSSVHVYKINLINRTFNLLRTFINNKPFQVNYFYSLSIQKKIDQKIKEIKPDHIFCQLIRMAWYLKGQFKIPSTLDYMDAFSKGIERRVDKSPFWKKPLFMMEHERLKSFENLAFEFFQNHCIISNSDLEFIFHEKKHLIQVIPNGINTEYFSKNKYDIKYDLVFTGNLNYAPNINAATYICKEIYPLLKIKFPTIKILIVGSNPSSRVKKLANNDITIKGWQDDIRKSYCSGKIFFAPMRIGTGLQNKLLEAMSLEIPCVTSSLANQSLQANHKENIYIGDSTNECISIISYLLKHEEIRDEIGKKGRKFVLENFSWKKSTDQLIEIIN